MVDDYVEMVFPELNKTLPNPNSQLLGKPMQTQARQSLNIEGRAPWLTKELLASDIFWKKEGKFSLRVLHLVG